jgi:DnaK suppressor protein
MDVETYRTALLNKRGELLGGTAAKPLQWTMENNSGRQGDMADQASGNNEVHIQLKLKQTDAKILQAIQEALLRIEAGTYGVCKDCGEPIAEARLKAIPWTRSCITCKEKQKA